MDSALQSALDVFGKMHAPNRADVLSRYRLYSDMRSDLQTAALKNVPQSSILGHAKRIGLSDGKVLFTDDQIELTLVFDLAVYTAKPGRTRAIDRLARRRLATAAPTEALVLSGLCESRFSLFRVIEKPEPVGILLEDLLRRQEVWLLDNGLERSAKTGAIFAMRVARIETFMMTCGAVVPLDSAIVEELIAYLEDGVTGLDFAALANDSRFATSIYELAIELDLMSLVAYR